jgi:hypothetical protein
MKFVKHFYYPYYYIESFNGSIISVFFLDNTFHFEDEADIFINKFSIKTIKKSKKVIEESNNVQLEDKFKNLESPLFDNFFFEFFKNK